MLDRIIASSIMALGLLWSLPAAGADSTCVGKVAELRQAVQEAAIDDITRSKIDELLENAAGLCEEGEYEKAETRLVRAHDLLRSDVEG